MQTLQSNRPVVNFERNSRGHGLPAARGGHPPWAGRRVDALRSCGDADMAVYLAPAGLNYFGPGTPDRENW